MKQLSVVVGALLCAPLVFAQAGGGEPAAGGGKAYKTPQEVFDAFKTSLKKEDWKGFCECLTPDSEKALAGVMAVGIEFVKGFLQAFAEKDESGKLKGAIQSLDAVYKKHRLSKEDFKDVDLKQLMGAGGKQDTKAMIKTFAKVGGRIKDRPGFISDLMKALSSMGPAAKEFQFEGNPQLQDVKVSGDTATGIIVHTKKGKEQKDPIAFKKIGGSWKIELPEALFNKNRGGPGGGPPGGQAPPPPPEARRSERPAVAARLIATPARSRR
jgi:hypothetical protein